MYLRSSNNNTNNICEDAVTKAGLTLLRIVHLPSHNSNQTYLYRIL